MDPRVYPKFQHKHCVPSENLLINMPALVSSAVFSLSESIENTRRKSKAANPGPLCGLRTQEAREIREFGSKLQSSGMLIFISLHWEHRRQNLLSVAKRGQSVNMCGHTKFAAATNVWKTMKDDAQILTELQTLVKVWNLLCCYSGDSQSAHLLVGWKMLHRAWRRYPNSVQLLTEYLFSNTLQGVSLGIKPGEGRPAFEDPGTQPPADKEGKVPALHATQARFLVLVSAMNSTNNE